MKHSIVVVTTLLALMGSSRADEAVQKEKVFYSDARKTLLSRGFRPYAMPGVEPCADDSHRCYPELMNCTSKRRWSCDYTWKLEGVVYQVETSTEDPIVDSFYCILNCVAAKKVTLATEE